MQYEFRGKTLHEAVRKAVARVAHKSDNRAECERISRLRAQHANNIAAISEDIGDTIEDINDRIEALGDDFRDAVLSTATDVASIVFAGAAIIRLARTAAAIDVAIARGSGVNSVFAFLRALNEYERRLNAFRQQRDITRLSSSIAAQRMDLGRSVRALSDLDHEWERLGCARSGRRDPRRF